MADLDIKKGEIGNALESVAPDHVVTTADGVFDEGMQMYQNEINANGGAYDISRAKAVDGNLAVFVSLSDALGTNGANVPVKTGGMSVKFVLNNSNYAVTKQEGLTTAPEGTLITSNPNVNSGTYKAAQLVAYFATLPTATGAGNALVYYKAISGDTTTYTSWTITLQSSDNKYVQYRLMATSWSTNESDWAICSDTFLVENPVFIRVYTDKDNKILWAIKTDGDIYYGVGCPQQVKDYISQQIYAFSDEKNINKILAFLGDFINSTTLSALINAKVDKVEGKGLSTNDYTNNEKAAVATINIIENQEFLYLLTDNSNPPGIIFGYRVDGTVMLGFGIPDEIKAYVETEINKIKTGTDTTTIDGINKITAFLSGFTTNDTLIGALANITNAKDGELRDWLGYKLSVSSAAANDVLFTDEDVTIGKDYLFSFTLASSNGAIGFFDSSNQRISYIGAGGNQGAGFKFIGRATIPTGFKTAKVIWGGITNISVCEYTDPKNLMEDIRIAKGDVKSYFEEEMDLTIETILNHTTTPAVVLPILTDSHWGTTVRAEEQLWETIDNVRFLCHNCYCDGVIHLGDLLMSSWNSTLLGQGKTQAETDVITARMMSEHLNRYAAAHPDGHAYFVGGNHDGNNLQNFKYTKWYAMIGRKENTDATIHKAEFAPYFYVDFEKCNLRCIFLEQPNDYENNGTTTFGYTKDMLDWLIDTALDVTDGTHVVMFSHIPPMQASYISGGVLENRSSFYGLCNAFHNHTTFSDNVVSCDFSALQTSKLLCYVCGHTHGDWIYEPNETFEGTALISGETVSWTYENGMPCPVVIITNTFVGGSGDGETRNGDCGTYHVPRTDGTVTQDAWDTFLYNPSEKKIYFIRFGSGNDRIVDLSSVI